MKIVVTALLVIATALVVMRLTRKRSPAAPSRPLTPKHIDSPDVSSCEVCFILPDERVAICDRKVISLPAGSEITGALTLRPSDGPLGIREHEHPSFILATFDFSVGGRNLRYTGFISQWDLWAPSGTEVQTECPQFEDQTDQLDGMMDGRDDWSYVLPDGTTHTNRLKYTSCKFWVMTQPSSLLVRCQYYDQNPDIADTVKIFYARPLDELLLFKETKVFHDVDGNPEDFDLHGGDTIILQKL